MGLRRPDRQLPHGLVRAPRGPLADAREGTRGGALTAVADRAVVLDGAIVPSREVVGNKGRSIAWMLSLGLPVPPALCLPIDECRRFHAAGEELEPDTWSSVLAGIAGLEKKLGRSFGGGAQPPLLVSVRSGAAVSM